MKRSLLAGIGLLAAQIAMAQVAFEPGPTLSGTLRVWGHPAMDGVVRKWAAGFARYQPGVKIETQLMGSATAMPGLYSGRADIALIGRESNVTDDNGFLRPKQYLATRYE